MLSCKTRQQKHRQEPASSQELPGGLGGPTHFSDFVPHPISCGALTFIDSSELQQLVLLLPTQRTEEQQAPTQLARKKETARNVYISLDVFFLLLQLSFNEGVTIIAG